jgi:hypothetical protein
MTWWTGLTPWWERKSWRKSVFQIKYITLPLFLLLSVSEQRGNTLMTFTDGGHGEFGVPDEVSPAP